MNTTLQNMKKLGGCVYRPLEKFLDSPALRKCTYYANYYKHIKIDRNMVLYEAFDGRGMLCNPYAIFLELLNCPDFKHFKHVWVLDDLNNHKLLIEEYAKYKNVFFVQRETKKYLKCLCKAKYLINNSTFPTYYTKKDGQVYINTWHGIPLKKIGYDLPNGKTEAANTIRNFMQTDYLISANDALTQMYRKAYKLDNIYKGKIIEEGYPRLDILLRSNREELIKKFHRYGVNVAAEKKVILYAPTWRGASWKEADADVECYFEFKKKIEDLIDTTEYQILIKVHQRVFQLAKEKLNEDYFVPATIDANEALALADILISDYSSIYFDYLATDKPVLFYIKDLDKYKNERGLYKDIDCLPGPCSDTISGIAGYINQIDESCKTYKNKYKAEKEYSNKAEVGKISSRIVDVVFRNLHEGYSIRKLPKTKKMIFFSRSGMRVNGISSSILNLLNQIDYDKYDVSLMITEAKSEDQTYLLNKINPNVRVFYRNSTNNCTLWEQICDFYQNRYDKINVYADRYKREWRRSYGNAEFDYLIDFDGYNPYYAILLLQCAVGEKLIWLHNDMYSEFKVRFPGLENVFNLYRYFDGAVSCTYEIMLQNREKLAGRFCEYEKFRYAKNLMDINGDKEKIAENVLREYNRKTYIEVNRNDNGSCLETKLIPYFPDKDEFGNKCYRFVTIGRLSVEKNHMNLIHAFSRFHEENPNSVLYIIGDGPLKKDLLNTVQRLGLADRVILTLNVKNVFAILKYCDCFIFPSLHEGQGMVVNEARILHMPIILSNFLAVNSVSVENGQLVVGMSEEELYKGMKAFADGNVPCNYQFDADEYNKQAYKEFEDAIEGKGSIN